MKKLLALLLTLTMVAALAACGAKPAEPAAPAEGDAAPAKVYKVAMICDSSISDGGWGAACYSAMVAAAEAKGWETKVTDSIDVAAYADTIDSYCQLGFDMIFAPGNQYTDATKQVAANYPDICFALLNGTKDDVSDNIMAILPNADQIGYMAGALAGLMTKTNVLGFIGGVEIDTTKAKLAGYEAA
ncbi:MAG: BMP family ABC transporter substrate-binding protein, partial [Oscillospiraceae bacterium]